jgi:hypothetical protein
MADTHGLPQAFEAFELPVRERHLIGDECIEILEGVCELEAAVVVVSVDPAVMDPVPTTGHVEEVVLLNVVTAGVWSVFRRDRFGVPLLF